MNMKFEAQVSGPSVTQWPAVRIVEKPSDAAPFVTTDPEQIHCPPLMENRIRPDCFSMIPSPVQDAPLTFPPPPPPPGLAMGLGATVNPTTVRTMSRGLAAAMRSGVQ